ncbi:MAG: hypothetical protein JW987_06000 [Anaerolineaceae bacterium]|nr:hypothetical protein [Anaerolineaceae bacterium]
MKPRLRRVLAFALLVSLILSGCGSFTNAEQLDYSETIYADGTYPVGQTFYASFNGLTGIDVYLEPPNDLQSEVTLHVRQTPHDTTDLASARLPADRLNGPGYYRFSFPAIKQSTLKGYYFFIAVADPDTIVVKAGPGAGYVDGSAYRDHEPIDQQVAFRLAYDIPQAIGGLLLEGLRWIYFLLVMIFLYVLPGWVMLPLALPSVKSTVWFSRVALSAGVSLAVYPILFLFTHIIGIRAGAFYAWVPGGAALVYLLYPLWTRRKTLLPLKIRLPKLTAEGIALFFVVSLIIFSRFWVIRTVNAPFWGDSYQHTMITQLLIDHKGLFSSWLPYADLHSFTYHFGFHAATVVFHWVTNLGAIQSTLWVGQILNILAVLVVYPMAVRFTGQCWAGVVAVLFAGLLSNYPMYYVNWGRYTQLAGQVILPVAIVMIFEAFEREKADYRLAIGTGIVLAGLGLTHYRILILVALLLLARGIFLIGTTPKYKFLFRNMVVMGASAGIVFLPWFINVYGGVLLNRTISIWTSGATATTGQGAAVPVDAVGLESYYPLSLWLAAILICLVVFWKRERELSSFILWFFFSLVLVNNHWLGLSIYENIGNFTILIMAYLWIGVVFGAGIVWLMQVVKLDHARWAGVALILPVFLVATLGFKDRITVLDPIKHSLLTRPDEKAMAWIDQNLPEDAIFLVNSFLAFRGSSAVGSDGGWWLPVAGHRSTTLPPLLYDIEEGPRPDYKAWVNLLTAAIEGSGVTSPEVQQMLKERGVTHVYIGQQQGRVNNSGTVLDPLKLAEDTFFRIVYHHDHVWVFEILQK